MLLKFKNCKNLKEFKGKFASADNRCLIVNGNLIAYAPVGLTSDTIQLSQYSDAILYVCREKVTQQQYIHNLNTLIEEKHLQNVSLILNGTSDTESYGYGYGYTTKL